MRYGKWPHEVAQLPFHYYLALREDWVKENTIVTDADKLPGDDDVIEFNAETFSEKSV